MLEKKLSKLERQFQSDLITDIKDILPGCIVFKTDPNYIQGFPDLMVLWKDKWASLEVKRFEGAPYRPNQKYYIELMNNMSFSRVVYPENKEEVLHAIQQAFGS